MSHLPLRASAVTVTTESTKFTDLQHGELRIQSQGYKLASIADGSSMEYMFDQPIRTESDFPSHTARVGAFAGRKQKPSTSTAKTSLRRHKVTNRKVEVSEYFDPQKILNDGLVITKDGIRITFLCLEPTQPLPPTTQLILDECDKLRALAIGKTGVGKSSLINIAFGINEACSSHLQRGKADIEQELTSPANPYFVLHDSVGFEPGDDTRYDTVKVFIRKRQSGPPKQQLHTVWWCIQTPCAGGRLLEAAMDDFLASKQEIMANTPLIIVFTKFDGLVNELLNEMLERGEPPQDVQKRARAQAESIVRGRFIPRITELMREPCSFALVSTRDSYQDTVVNLVQLTHRLVSRHNGHATEDVQATSVLTSIAQRVVPTLKIQECINVGKQRYWKALRTSPDFVGHTIWDCLSVIHTDIITIWNIYDPAHHLKCDKFKRLVVELVQEVQVREVTRPSGYFALSGVSLVATVSGFVGALANPATPIVLPIVAGLAGVMWLYNVYQHSKNVQQRFITYIIDLTHVMEILFILVAGRHERLTRRTIKFALKVYRESDILPQVHSQIETYRKAPGREDAVKLIESLIKPEVDEGLLGEYYTEIKAMDLSKLRLDKDDEGW